MEKQCHDIREVKHFVDSNGREVMEFVQVFGKTPESPLVKGTVVITVGMISPNGMRMPPQNVRLEWPFPEGTSVKRAFEIFDDHAKAEVKRWEKEQQEKAKAAQIVVARAMPPPLLGADGKALGVKG